MENMSLMPSIPRESQFLVGVDNGRWLNLDSTDEINKFYSFVIYPVPRESWAYEI